MKQYIVDAFSDTLFHGNQAAICILDKWPEVSLMHNIAFENNFSETAFVVKTGNDESIPKYHLRWFTPSDEVDLCGHATLATAFVLFNFYEQTTQKIIFETMSGQLTVNKNGDLYEMNFPIYDLKPIPVTDEMEAALGARPAEAYMGRDMLCVFDSENTIENMKPDFDKVKELPGLLVHVTAKGTKEDCVSRSFGPKIAISEDPVCGSGHCHIAPYWSGKMNKPEIIARQASRRGGTLYCKIEGERMTLAGKATLYSVSELSC